MFFASLFCGCVCAVACGVFLCLAVWLLLSLFSVCVLVGLLMRASARVCLFVFHCLPLRLFVCWLVSWLYGVFLCFACLFACVSLFVCALFCFVLLLNSCGVCGLRLVFQHRALQLFVQPQLVVKMLTCVVRLLACLRLPVCLCVACALGLLECLFVCFCLSVCLPGSLD